MTLRCGQNDTDSTRHVWARCCCSRSRYSPIARGLAAARKRAGECAAGLRAVIREQRGALEGVHCVVKSVELRECTADEEMCEAERWVARGDQLELAHGLLRFAGVQAQYACAGGDGR